MTESQQPDRQAWSEKDLPVLTEVADQPEMVLEGVDIPDFDFSSEMELVAQSSSGSDAGGLEFPPELLLDDQQARSTLAFDQLPSLDLASGEAEASGAGFTFETEPRAGDSAPVGLDALMARAMLEPAPSEGHAADAATLAEEIRALDQGFDAVADMPIPLLQRPPAHPVEMELGLPVAELPASEAPGLNIPELIEEADDVPDQALLAAAAPDIPELTALAEEAEITAEPQVAAAPVVDIPELTALAEAAEITAEPQVAAAPAVELPELTALAVEAAEIAAEPQLAAAPAVDLPELTALAEAAEIAAEPQPAAVPVVDIAEPAVALAAAILPDMASASADAEPFRTISLDSLPRGVLNGGVKLEEEPDPDAPPSMEDMIRAAEQTLAEELRKQAMLRMNKEFGLAGVSAAGISPEQAPAAVFEPQVAAVESALPAADALPEPVVSAPGTPEPVETAEAVEVARVAEAVEPASLPEPLPVVAEARLEPLPEVAQTRAEPEPSLVLAAAIPAAQAPAPAEHRPVEIINVAGLASSPAPQPQMPPLRKSYVTLVDENMLIDSLYHKILPRMKVELSLWLQDALDHQAKQMLSGVMHQLKEDYEMLFSETLRDSLRQAISEMGREDRGDRF